MSMDVTRATQIIDQNFINFDTARQQDPAKADGKISQNDLKAVVANANGTFSAEEVSAAQFLLDSQAARSFLDVGAGRGFVDGTISREDIDGALLTIESGGLEMALLDTAAGRGWADGHISQRDLDAAQNDPGIPQDLKDALDNLPDDLPLQTQLGVVFALRNNAGDLHALVAIQRLAGSDAFKGLDEAQQRQALALFGHANDVSAAARAQLGGIDLSSTEALQAFMLTEARPADLWRSAQPDSGFPDEARKDYSISGPERIEHEFPSTTRPDATETLPAWKYTVEVDGQSIEVILPHSDARDGSSYSYPTLEQIAKGLAAQPSVSLEATDRVVLLPGNPKRTEDGRIIDNTAPMWAGNATITINPHSADNPREQKNIDYTFLHETAHLVQQPWKGDMPLMPPGWNQAVDSDRLFSTHYADNNYVPEPNQADAPSRNPVEDFAETYMIYQAVKGTPDEAQMRALMPARFEILDRMFP